MCNIQLYPAVSGGHIDLNINVNTNGMTCVMFFFSSNVQNSKLKQMMDDKLPALYEDRCSMLREIFNGLGKYFIFSQQLFLNYVINITVKWLITYKKTY